MTEETDNEVGHKSHNQTNIDNGYAWVVLIGCFMMQFLAVGSIKVYGVLYTEMIEYYSSGYGNTAWIGSMASLLAFILGPYANYLCTRFSFRTVTFVGGMFVAVGYTMSAFVTKMEFMYLTFFCCGIGYGLTFLPCSTLVSFYFDKRRALANGITISGSGVGTLALPFLYKVLIGTYGLQGTLLIVGAILFNICVAAFLFRQPSLLVNESQRTKQDTQKHEDTQNNKGLVPRKKHRIISCKMNLKFSLLKDPIFTINVISFTLCGFSYIGNITLIPSHVKALGYNEDYVALSVTIFGAAEVFARPLIGWFADLKIIQPKYIYVICMFIGAIITFIVPLFDSFTFMAVYAAVMSMFPGTFFSLLSVMVIDVVGLELFPAAFGLITLCSAFGAAISQPALGWLKDSFGNWHPAFMLTASTLLLAGVTILTEPIIIWFGSKQQITRL